MSKITKIVVGMLVIVVIIAAGYVYFTKKSNSNITNQNNNNSSNQGVIMGTGNPYDATHLQRTLQSGGTPGDGGGG